MRLSSFIMTNMEPILQEWEDFARSLGAVTESMDAKALRDNAKQILEEVAADLETSQTEEHQEEKSKGNAEPSYPEAAESGAGRHGVVRAMEGFTLDQMVAEYRALRASVLRLWTKKQTSDVPFEAEQITRFNESIDAALAESIKRYGRDVQQLIASTYARDRMAALGTLSAGLGHDMGNALLPMGVSLSKLEQTTLTPETKPMLDALRRSIEHLRGLTRGLRALSADPADSRASPSTTELRSWWAEASSPYKWGLSPKVELHAVGLESPTLPVVAVPNHVLMQAVFNLVQNASDALGERGGNIWIAASVNEDRDAVALEVRDDGPGMDAQTLARCTDPFFTTKPRGRGTGLSLPIVRTAVERYGGRLIIKSAPDRGSSFTLIMPAAKRDDPPRSERIAILTLRDARMRAMVSTLLAGVGVQATIDDNPGRVALSQGKMGPHAPGFLWVSDDSGDPLEVQQFLVEGGPNVRVVMLGTILQTSPGSKADAALHDGRLIQIAASPDHVALQDALRRAVTEWAS